MPTGRPRARCRVRSWSSARILGGDIDVAVELTRNARRGRCADRRRPLSPGGAMRSSTRSPWNRARSSSSADAIRAPSSSSSSRSAPHPRAPVGARCYSMTPPAWRAGLLSIPASTPSGCATSATRQARPTSTPWASMWFRLQGANRRAEEAVARAEARASVRVLAPRLVTRAYRPECPCYSWAPGPHHTRGTARPAVSIRG